MHPIASAWRPTLRAIVAALAHGDYAGAGKVPGVAPLAKQTAAEIEAYLQEYGETLVELPDDTWATSVASWERDHWVVLLDLWTEESGSRGLMLHLRVFEAEPGFRFVIEMVYDPMD